jgi:alpha-ketoglutarate-dependent 2,4-dichlorophenoxyacetate dioxygenase
MSDRPIDSDYSAADPRPVLKPDQGRGLHGRSLRQLHPLFAAEAAGIDLAQPIDAATLDAIWQAIDRYAVMVLRDQQLDDTQLRDFAARFGPLEIGRSAASGGRRRLDSLGNRLWHTDASYMPTPVVLGLLHAVAVPPASALGGGETEFADM